MFVNCRGCREQDGIGCRRMVGRPVDACAGGARGMSKICGCWQGDGLGAGSQVGSIARG